MNGPKIAFMGAGAVGSYTGGYMAQAGEDVTFIDPWPEHVECMRTKGLTISHSAEVDSFTVEVRALHVTEAERLAKEAPIDIAFVCMKSYDTAWATALISQYLAPGGFVVSLQNCMNEETIASVVGWGKTLGCVASQILVGVYEPGHVHRGAGKGGAAHVVYRAGEVHGRITPRAEEVCRLVSHADSAKATSNLWGERWSKLVANSMFNGMSACTGASSAEMVANPSLRDFALWLGSEAVRVGQALGFGLEEIYHVDPEILARAGEGDPSAKEEFTSHLGGGSSKVSNEQRPSMGQDMLKGRRTEIEFLNGLVVRKGAEVGVSTRANAELTDIVKRVERGDLDADPKNITELGLD